MEEQAIILYTVVIDGKPKGPFNLDDIKKMTILPGTFIRKPGMDDYKEAHEFPELRALFGFRFTQTAPQYFASFDQRLLAAVLDYFAVLMVYIFLVLMSFIVIEEKQERIMIAVMFLPAIPVCRVMYSIFADCSSRQGTIGKVLMNIRVTDLAGSRISFGLSVVRNLAKLLSVLPLFFGYLYIFLNKKNQSWHDIAANTLVIKDRLI